MGTTFLLSDPCTCPPHPCSNFSITVLNGAHLLGSRLPPEKGLPPTWSLTMDRALYQ